MPALLANRECSIADAARYERHRPEQTLLYQVVERHYPVFLAELEGRGHTLHNYVQREFDGFLKVRSSGTWLFARPLRGLPC